MSMQSHQMESQRTGRSRPAAHILPEGLYRWKEFAGMIPFSRETWRKRVLSGAAPAPVHISGACTAWRGAAILDWLRDPNGYRQDNGKENPSAD